VPAGHVTFVSVAATARRRGVLTRFMSRQLADIRAAGEPIAALWASEGRIYQRFGYGSAARRLTLAADTREVRLTAGEPAGRLREGKPAQLREWIAKVYDEACAQRPGWSDRATRHWDYRLADPESWRRGASSLRAVVHEGDHGVDGYALFRVSDKWDEGGPAGEVRILEQVATSPSGYAALWHFLLTMDLTRTATMWYLSIDEPLQFMVNEPRRLATRMSDGLWVRVVDVPAALAARRYAAGVDVVIDVTDNLLSANTGRWRLVGSASAASCVATSEPADLSCDVSVLGTAYLGGTPLGALADAGMIREHTPGALATATTAFGWHRSPSAIEVF
jgi:predicted acetyltransferase